MGKIIRNGITYGGGSGSGSATVRYVNDESDANYDWVQIKNASGNWENWKSANLNGLYIIRNGVLNSDYVFTAYNDKSMYVTQNESSVTFHKPNNSTAGYLSSNLIDFTQYSKLKITVTESSDQYNYVCICESAPVNGLKVQTLLPSAKDYEIDISAISGVHCISISLPNNGVRRLTITDMHLE